MQAVLVRRAAAWCALLGVALGVAGWGPASAAPAEERPVIVLTGRTAEVAGPPIQNQGGVFRYWQSADTAVSWRATVRAASVVEVQIDAAVDQGFAGSTFELRIGDQTLTGEMAPTEGWESYQTLTLGTVPIEPGEIVVRLKPTRVPNGAFGNVRAVRLKGIQLADDASDGPVDASGPVRVFTTARHRGSRISERDGLRPAGNRRDSETAILVDPDRPFQTVEGFGGAFTEAAASVFEQLGAANQREVLRAYFDAGEGHGYRLCRTHINSCDFSLGSYAYTEVDGDVELEHFSIDRDRQRLIPLIHAAQATAGDEPIKMLASPWSPPAWMKTNGQMTEGGQLKPEYRDAWARYYCRYIDEYAKEGIPIWAITVQNEPAAVQRWESCIYSAEEERDFVRDHLGPALHRGGHEGVRLIVWDHNRDLLFDRASTVFDAPRASKYVWGAGFHWYADGHYHQAQMLHDFYPDKKLLFTEGCLEHGPHIGDWSGGERYARSIINDLNHGAVGWIDWNLLLDTEGGPNHVGNYCSAPILGDIEDDQLIYNSSYYYLGHFARFIRPGARRVLCGASGEELLATAFRNRDGSVAVVVLNQNDYAVPFRLAVGGVARQGVANEHSIMTFVVDTGSGD